MFYPKVLESNVFTLTLDIRIRWIMDIRIRCNNIEEELSGHKKLKNGKPRLGEFTLTYINLDTPNLA